MQDRGKQLFSTRNCDFVSSGSSLLCFHSEPFKKAQRKIFSCTRKQGPTSEYPFHPRTDSPKPTLSLLFVVDDDDDNDDDNTA